MKYTDKDIERRQALCRALFLAPARVFRDVETFFNISMDSMIEDRTGERPGAFFPLDYDGMRRSDNRLAQRFADRFNRYQNKK